MEPWFVPLAGVATLLALATVASLWLGRSTEEGSLSNPKPSWVERHEAMVDDPQIILPASSFKNTVPLKWLGLTLGTRKDAISTGTLETLDKPQPWADSLYFPDSADRQTSLGLSFHQDRLYRIVRHLGDTSPVPAQKVLALSMRLYGKADGYEYLTATFPHVVTQFKSDSRRLKLDFVKTTEGMYVYQIELIDIEEATLRETADRRP